MPETSADTTSAANGTAVAVSATTSSSTYDKQRYRPAASTNEVHNEIISALARVVSTAMDNAASFVYLAEHYDREATTRIRYGHLVDATECLEIAMTHLGQLKAAMNHRLRMENEDHMGVIPF